MLPNSKVVLKYVVLHLAELAVLVGGLIVLEQLVDVATWLLVATPIVWALKDVALFPKVWRAYAPSDSDDPMSRLMGLEAVVMFDLDPVGYVRVRGEVWKAELRGERGSAQRGETTRVVEARRMMLIVEPDRGYPSRLCCTGAAALSPVFPAKDTASTATSSVSVPWEKARS